MATVHLKGTPLQTIGTLPTAGSHAPDFTLTASDLSDKSLKDFSGKNIILNIFPSIDTGTCAQSVRSFNKMGSAKENTVVICVSKDLPFAQARFCGAEGLENVVNLSDFKTGHFGRDYGVSFTEGPLAPLHSRAVVVINTAGKVIYTEQVNEIVDEPNYEAALAVL